MSQPILLGAISRLSLSATHDLVWVLNHGMDHFTLPPGTWSMKPSLFWLSSLKAKERGARLETLNLIYWLIPVSLWSLPMLVPTLNQLKLYSCCKLEPLHFTFFSFSIHSGLWKAKRKNLPEWKRRIWDLGLPPWKINLLVLKHLVVIFQIPGLQRLVLQIPLMLAATGTIMDR